MDDNVAKEAYTAVLRIALYLPSGSQWEGFTAEVSRRSLEKYDFHFGDEKVDILLFHQCSNICIYTDFFSLNGKNNGHSCKQELVS